jgi:predicted Zn finger-like uncharacterized protein
MTGAAFTPGEHPSLFTQCAKCETVFRLSAEVLRAAGCQVRCGRCGEVFNALARLAEDAAAFPAGESPLDMETRADEILRSAVVPAVNKPSAPPNEPENLAATDVEFARLQVLDLELYDDDRPPATPRDAANKANQPKANQANATKAAKATKPSPAADDGPEDNSMEFTLPPGELDRIFVEPPPRTLQPLPVPAGAPAAGAPDETVETLEPSDSRVAGLEVSEEVRREMLAGFEEDPLREIAAQRSRSLPTALWLGAGILLALTLSAQMIHENREWFAAHAPLRGSLRSVYAALGVALPAPANLSAYQLRQWGVTGEPGANGTLRVRASILNTAAQLQPYPLLRVTLANRFGSRIGAREFEPTEYMGKPTARLLAPGERVDATLDILDPGKDAEGFEIDVCLRGVDQKISCASDVATQVKQ